MATVFIDGEAGTTGLQIRERLQHRRDIDLVLLGEDRRKDREARREALNAADAVILCLPDEAAREAVALIDSPGVRVVDASTAHRVADGWTYGFPEMGEGQAETIAASTRVANPGCYPTGFIALVRPLVEAGIVPVNWPLTVNAVSGYSGGGKAMIAEFEGDSAPNHRAYGLSLGHKHVPEMQAYAGLVRRPLFTPAVGRFRQGMLVEVPLVLEAMPGSPGLRAVQTALEAAYAGRRFVEVATRDESEKLAGVEPDALNGTNRMRLYAFGSDRHARLVAQLDNLGKGASGAAVQNLNLMLGLDEAAGLD